MYVVQVDGLQPAELGRSGSERHIQGQSLSAVQGDPINTEGLKMPDTIRTAGIVSQYARDIKAGEAIRKAGETYSTGEKCQVEPSAMEGPLSLGSGSVDVRARS